MPNAFQQGMQFAQERTKRTRVEKGVNALADEFGDQALAPQEFQAVRGTDRLERQFGAQQDQLGIENARADVIAANTETDRGIAEAQRAAGALLGVYEAGFKNGIDPAQITERFAPVLQKLGVDPASFPDLNASFTEDPEGTIDALKAAIRGQRKRGTGVRQRPIRVVNEDGTLSFFQVDEATGEFVDTGLVPAQSVEAGRRLSVAEANVDAKQPGFKGAVSEEQAVGTARGEIRAGDLTPGQRAVAQSKLALEVNVERGELLQNTIQKAIGQADSWTAGFASLTSIVPGSPAANLEATLDTIQATIGFEELQRLRDNSKTGGALGQVSNIENLLLQAVWGNLQESQGPEQLRENLAILGKAIEKKNRRLAEAWKIDFGTDYTGEGTPIPGTDTEVSPEDQALFDKYGIGQQ